MGGALGICFDLWVLETSIGYSVTNCWCSSITRSVVMKLPLVRQVESIAQFARTCTAPKWPEFRSLSLLARRYNCSIYHWRRSVLFRTGLENVCVDVWIGAVNVLNEQKIEWTIKWLWEWGWSKWLQVIIIIMFFIILFVIYRPSIIIVSTTTFLIIVLSSFIFTQGIPWDR